MKVLTKQGEIDRARGIIAFCQGKPFNINKSPEWALGWHEVAQKFRDKPQLAKCAAVTGMNRQCMRTATIGNFCRLHSKLSPRLRKWPGREAERCGTVG